MLFRSLPDSGPYGFVRLGSIVLFSADHPGFGRELFRSDGTAAGTFILKDIEGP